MWPGGRRAASKTQRAAAAAELRRRLHLVLRAMSVPDIAATTRAFMLAGWTVTDLHHALDHRPDGTPWPHTGAPPTTEPRRIRGWLTHRLTAWTTNGTDPRRSPSQRAHAQRAQAAAQARAAQERSEHHRARRARPDSPTKAHALARIRQTLQPTNPPPT